MCHGKMGVIQYVRGAKVGYLNLTVVTGFSESVFLEASINSRLKAAQSGWGGPSKVEGAATSQTSGAQQRASLSLYVAPAPGNCGSAASLKLCCPFHTRAIS